MGMALKRVETLGGHLGLDPDEVSACLRLHRPMSEMAWVKAEDLGGGSLQIAVDNMEAGRYIEYVCYETNGNPQGRAVLQLSSWEDRSRGLLLGTHGPVQISTTNGM